MDDTVVSIIYACISYPLRNTKLNLFSGNSGGQDILLDKGGTDATEDFEEVEHSKGALEILSGLEIGRLKRQVSHSLLRCKPSRASALAAKGVLNLCF